MPNCVGVVTDRSVDFLRGDVDGLRIALVLQVFKLDPIYARIFSEIYRIFYCVY